MWNRTHPRFYSVILLSGVLLSAQLGCNGTFRCVGGTPVPTIISISPNPASVLVFQSGGILIVNGTKFVPASVVIVNGVTRPTVFVNGGVLKVTLFPSDTRPGNVNIVVSTPGTFFGGFFCENGGTSGGLVLTITG